MNAAELEQALVAHTSKWRASHLELPGVDWGRVTRPVQFAGRQLVLAGAIVAVLIAAIVTATVGHHLGATSAQRPPALAPPDPANPELGSPPRFFGIEGAGVTEVDPGFGGSRVHNPLVVAAGGTGAGTTLYDVRIAGHGHLVLPCESTVEVTSYVSSDLLHGRKIALAGQPQRLATIDGLAAAVPLAISPGDGQLALVTTSEGCHGPDQIVFMSLHDGSIVGRESLSTTKLQIDALAWSADGEELAYRLDPAGDSGPFDPPVTAGQNVSGTYVLNIHDAPHDLETNPRILPAATPGAAVRYGPVFWWHGGWAATSNGTLYRLDERGGLAAPLAANFPTQVDSIASDQSGNHLLITSGSASYRWDYGRLSPIAGHYFQPVW